MDRRDTRRAPTDGSTPDGFTPDGFTLVELLIVVAILAILSVVALPRFGEERTHAVASALAANVTAITMMIEIEHQKGDGAWPATLDEAWFAGGILPLHPDNLAGVPKFEVANQPGRLHPRNKLLVSNSPGAYWYNAAEGVVRARVKEQGSLLETLALYNEVNQSQLGSLAEGGAQAAGP